MIFDNKVMVTVIDFCNDCGGPDVEYQFIIEDTTEERQKLIDDYVGSNDRVHGGLKGFLDGSHSIVGIELASVDHEEPSYRTISIKTKTDIIQDMTNEFIRDVEEVNEMFEVEE